MATHLKLFGAISAVRRVIISLVAIYADEPTDHDSTQRVDAMDYSPIISRFAWARPAAPWGMTGIRRRKSPPLRLSLALELSGQSRNVYQQFTADPKAVQAMMLTGCPSGCDGFPTLIGALRNGDHSDRADCPICSPQYPNLRRARSRPVPMGLCAVSRWCEGCRNKGKVQFGSRPNFRTDHAGFPNPVPPRSNPGDQPSKNNNLPYISTRYGGDGVSQSH
jgi:hypothetical protein